MQHGKDTQKRNDESRGEIESERLHAEWRMWEELLWVSGKTGPDWGELGTKAPDLAVRCSRGQESVLASGHLWSWKRKWGKSDSNFFSEPVKKYYQHGKINFMTQRFNRLLKTPTKPVNAYLASPSGYITKQNKSFKTFSLSIKLWMWEMASWGSDFSAV